MKQNTLNALSRLRGTRLLKVNDPTAKFFFTCHPRVQQCGTLVMNLQKACSSQARFVIFQGTELYSWGRNINSELGVGQQHSTSTPTPVKDFTGVCVLACGLSHSLAITDDHKVYGWGSNHFNQLGDSLSGSGCSFPTPQLLPYFTDKQVVKVACGSAFSAAVTSEGKLITWGMNNNR
jgi:E3 ubiquitin-protein ligase HERC2